MSKNKNTAPFREYAGALVAVLIVLSYVVSGFVIVLCGVLLGVDVKFPGDWNAAMLSLSSASLGYLIGKQVDTGRVPGHIGPQVPEWAPTQPTGLESAPVGPGSCPDCPHKEPAYAEPFQVPPGERTGG